MESITKSKGKGNALPKRTFDDFSKDEDNRSDLKYLINQHRLPGQREFLRNMNRLIKDQDVLIEIRERMSTVGTEDCDDDGSVDVYDAQSYGDKAAKRTKQTVGSPDQGRRLIRDQEILESNRERSSVAGIGAVGDDESVDVGDAQSYGVDPARQTKQRDGPTSQGRLSVASRDGNENHGEEVKDGNSETGKEGGFVALGLPGHKHRRVQYDTNDTVASTEPAKASKKPNKRLRGNQKGKEKPDETPSGGRRGSSRPQRDLAKDKVCYRCRKSGSNFYDGQPDGLFPCMNCFGGSKPACGNYMHPAWECSDCREDEPLKLDDNLIKIWACSDCRVPPYDSNHTNQWYDPRYWGEDDDDDDEEEEEDGEPDDDQGDENNEAEDEDGANAREDEDEPANQSSKSHASGTATELHNVPSDDSSSLSSHDDEFEETEQVPASEHEQGPSDTKLQANNPMPATGPATERKNTTQQPQPLGPGRCRWCEDGTLAAAADDVLFPCSRCKTPVHHNAPCAGKAFDVTPQEEAEFLCWNCRPKPGSRDAANGATRKLDEDEDDDDQSGGHKKRKTGARKKDGKNTSAKSTPAQSLKTASKKGSTPGRSKHTGAVNGIDEPHEYEAEPLGQGPISLVNGPATEGAEGSSLSGRSRVGDSDIEIGRAGGIVDLTPMEDAQSNPSDSDTHSVPSPAYSDLTGSDAEYTLSDNGSASDNDSIDLNFRHEDMVLDRIVDSKPGAKNLAKHLVKKTSSSITSQEVGSKASSNEQGDSSSHSSISSDMGTPSPLNCGLKRDQMKSASVEELSLMAYRGPVFDSPFTALSRKDSFVVV